MVVTSDQKSFERVVFGLYLVLVFSLAFMVPSVDLMSARLTPTDLIFLPFFLCLVIGVVLRAVRFQWHTAYWSFAFYLAALIVSSIFSVNTRVSLTKLAGVGYLVLLAASTAAVVTNAARLRLATIAWFTGAIFAILFGVAAVLSFYLAPESWFSSQMTYHYGAVPVGNFPRITSTFISPSMFCNYLTVTVVLTLIAGRLGWISRNFAVVLLILTTASACFTVSIALGGLFVAFGLWIWLLSPSRAVSRLASILAFAGAAAFLLVAPFALSPLTEGRLEPSSRLLVWRDAFQTFLAEPITGKGLGTGAAAVTFQNYDGSWSVLTDAHNIILNVAAESGVLGLIALAAVIVAVLRSAFGRLRRNTVLTGFSIAFFAGFLYDGLTGSFEDARHLWVLIGFILAAERIGIGDELGDDGL